MRGDDESPLFLSLPTSVIAKKVSGISDQMRYLSPEGSEVVSVSLLPMLVNV